MTRQQDPLLAAPPPWQNQLPAAIRLWLQTLPKVRDTAVLCIAHLSKLPVSEGTEVHYTFPDSSTTDSCTTCAAAAVINGSQLNMGLVCSWSQRVFILVGGRSCG